MSMWPHHPVASIFRDMTDAEYASLRDDIEAHGIQAPVVLWRGHLVDGRHRARAAAELAVACPARSVDCEEAELPALVWSLNAERRQETMGERALAGARMANMKQGGDRQAKQSQDRFDSPPRPRLVSQSEAARIVGVSTPTVVRANAVLKSGDAELIRKVERGDVTVSEAAREAIERKPRKPRDVINVASAPVRRPNAMKVNTTRGNAVYAIHTQAGLLAQLGDDALPDEATKAEWRGIVDEALGQIKRFRRTLNAS